MDCRETLTLSYTDSVPHIFILYLTHMFQLKNYLYHLPMLSLLVYPYFNQ